MVVELWASMDAANMGSNLKKKRMKSDEKRSLREGKKREFRKEVHTTCIIPSQAYPSNFVLLLLTCVLFLVPTNSGSVATWPLDVTNSVEWSMLACDFSSSSWALLAISWLHVTLSLQTLNYIISFSFQILKNSASTSPKRKVQAFVVEDIDTFLKNT